MPFSKPCWMLTRWAVIRPPPTTPVKPLSAMISDERCGGAGTARCRSRCSPLIRLHRPAVSDRWMGTWLPFARTHTPPVMFLASMTVPATVTVIAPELVSVVPAGTPVVAAVGIVGRGGETPCCLAGGCWRCRGRRRRRGGGRRRRRVVVVVAGRVSSSWWSLRRCAESTVTPVDVRFDWVSLVAVVDSTAPVLAPDGASWSALIADDADKTTAAIASFEQPRACDES